MGQKKEGFEDPPFYKGLKKAFLLQPNKIHWQAGTPRQKA